MSIVEQLPKRLKLARSAAKLTQVELARAMGLSRDTIARLETGVQRITVEQLEGYAQHCQIPLTNIITIAGQSTTPRFSYYMPEDMREKLSDDLKSRFEKWYYSYLSLARTMFTIASLRLPQISPEFESELDAKEKAEELSGRLRSYWGLGEMAFDNPVQLLESQGLFVTGRDLGFGTTSFIAGELLGNDAYGIMVNTNPEIAIEQQRYALFEALSFIVCCEKKDRLVTEPNWTSRAMKLMEVFTETFAGSFLVPSQPLKKLISRFRHQQAITVGLIELLKDYFQVSAVTIIQRLRAIGQINRKTFDAHIHHFANDSNGLEGKLAPLAFTQEKALLKIAKEQQLEYKFQDWEDRFQPTDTKHDTIIKAKKRPVNSPEMKKFIKKRHYFWWSVPEDKKENLKPEAVVEALLNYGDIKDIKELFDLMGIGPVAAIFMRQIAGPRPNYKPQTINFFRQYFKRHA